MAINQGGNNPGNKQSNPGSGSKQSDIDKQRDLPADSGSRNTTQSGSKQSDAGSGASRSGTGSKQGDLERDSSINKPGVQQPSQGGPSGAKPK